MSSISSPIILSNVTHAKVRTPIQQIRHVGTVTRDSQFANSNIEVDLQSAEKLDPLLFRDSTPRPHIPNVDGTPQSSNAKRSCSHSPRNCTNSLEPRLRLSRATEAISTHFGPTRPELTISWMHSTHMINVCTFAQWAVSGDEETASSLKYNSSLPANNLATTDAP